MFRKFANLTSHSLPKKILGNQFQQCSSNVGETAKKQLDALEKSFNQVTLLGRVGNKPEQRGTEKSPVVNFSMATNINYPKDNEMMQVTDWHRVSVFKPHLRDKVTRFMMKGDRVLVNGRISYFEINDPTNSKLTYKSATVIADDVIWCSK